jgi:hypothetical protein
VLMDILNVVSNVQETDYTTPSSATSKVLAWFQREMQSEGYDSAHKLHYVKAIAHAVINGGLAHDEAAAPIVIHYVKHNKDCESFIKLFLQTLKKKLPKEGVWKIELGAMKQLFDAYTEKDEQEIYSDLQALVEKVAQAHPPMMRDRTALFNIVKGGISYSLEGAPQKILFLDVAVLPLSAKFTPQQKAKVLEYLEKKLRDQDLVADADNEDWNAYFDLEKELQGSSTRSRKGNTKKASTRSRRAMQMSLGDDDDDDDNVDMDSDNDPAGEPVDEEQENDDMNSDDDVASASADRRGSKRSSYEVEENADNSDDGDSDGNGDDDAGSVTSDRLSNSSGFKPKLRAQSGSAEKVPGRGSGFAARKKRRR